MANPTPPELQHLVRSTYAALMRRQGGVRRRGQQEMIGAIAGAVANAKKIGQDGSGARMLAINAPTGCGKSFAYGVGAIPVALANDLRVVISTSNVALQVQLIERDLVALAAVIPGMHTALVKGRSRLACGVKMRRAIEEGKDGTGEVAVMLHSLKSGTWNGDVDALQEQPAASTWKLCTNDRAGCAGRKCGSVNECPYYRSRAAIDSANVLVANHDMLLADARAGFVVLPKPENCVYILDEAHELPQKAIASLAGGHALEDAEAVALQASRMVGEVRRLAKGGPLAALAETAGASVELMAGALNEAKMAIAESARTTEVRDESRPVRFRGGLLPKWLGRAASECHRAAEASSVALLALMQALAGDEGDMLHERVRERLLADVGSAATRVEGIALVWKLMSSPRTAEVPVAKWIEVSPETRDLRVCASPIGVGEYLHETIWSKAAAAIHLSGTLMTVGGMDPYLKASGLALTPGGIRTLGVQSPFDHAKQAKLIVPRMVSPKDAEEHTKWLAANLPNMIRDNGEGNGTLVLFASLKQLRAVADAMPPWVQPMLLAQDRLTKREVVARHTSAIEAGQASVIFGSASYEEGLDLPRRLCTLVVVSKLPFSVPNDPVSEELRDHLESQGQSYFNEVAVPKACGRLTQQSGRLIRTEQDFGAIVVADPRLTDTRYGRAMLACLPPFSVSRELTLA